ncbi:MAG: reverse transcriptase family protein, partial [Candidatus Omnitrophota bacterium]
VLPPSMHGYVKKHSTLTNARCHVGKKYVAKFDISRFFPSIHYERVRKIFISLGHAQEESAILTRLVTIDYCLPHGYTTSPRLSCIALINLDRRISHILQFEKRGVHTFYSDDITVSSNSDISDLKELIIRAIELEGFSAERSKCVLKGKGERKEVTGYIVNESKISLPRVRRDKLKAILHNCIVSGPLSQIPAFEKSFGPLKLKKSSGLEKFKEVLRGKVVHVKASNEIAFRRLKRMFDLISWRSTV